MGGGSSGKRFKNFRKILRFYTQSFGFREPFQVLLDAEFIKEALSRKQNIYQELETVLDGKSLKLMTTECIKSHLQEFDKTSSSKHSSVVKKYEIIRLCKHSPSLSPCDCILDLIRGKEACKFFVASNDAALKERLRSIPGIPIIYSQKGMVFLESPSGAAHSQVAQKQSISSGISLEEKRLLKKLIPIPEKSARMSSKIAKKKHSQPNPLSCKKKRSQSNPVHKQKNS